jgi:hypothetical protein
MLYTLRLTSYVLRLTPSTLHLTSYVLHLTSYVLRLTSYVLQSTSHVLCRIPYVLRLPSYALRLTSYTLHVKPPQPRALHSCTSTNFSAMSHYLKCQISGNYMNIPPAIREFYCIGDTVRLQSDNVLFEY